MNIPAFASDLMTFRRRPRGDTISNPHLLLDAMGHCRRALIAAQDGVKPMGTAYHACQMVVKAIDALAYFVTDSPYYYSLGGSASTAGAPPATEAQRNWHHDRARYIAERDSDRPEV